jgi:hypothetical protein
MQDMIEDMTPAQMTEQAAALQNAILNDLGEHAIGNDARLIILALLGAAANVAIACRMHPDHFVRLVNNGAGHMHDAWPDRRRHDH